MKTLTLIAGTIILACMMISFLPHGEWVKVATKNCIVQFPQQPTDQSGIINTDKGDLKVNIYAYSANANAGDDNLAYIFTETEYPDSTINSDKKDKLDEFFKNSVEGVVNKFHGKLLSQAITTIDGFPGRQLKIHLEQQSSVINILFYLVKNRMYMLETVTAKDRDSNTSIKKFMNSFEIKL